MHRSVATIDSPEFINLQPLDINPLMSSCEIKVFYVGENRNKSYISKEVATEMAKTLRGAPIVGQYKQDKKDFGDHGERMIIDGDGIKFQCMTVPYGFVAPDAKVWFKKFEEEDPFGNSIIREYLMTTGYLWTGQFPECESAVQDDGKPHSMELDNDTLDGYWAENFKAKMDFFIINDAIVSKLCILGDDVEPCFEGSSVTAPKVSSTFSLDESFTQTLYGMMKDLKFALEGGQEKMADLEKTLDNSNENVISENEEITEGQSNEDVSVEDTTDTSFAKKDEEEDAKKEDAPASEDENKKEESKDDSENKEEEKNEDEKDKKKKSFSLEEYTAIETELSTLKAQYEELNTKYSALVEFKNEVDKEKKENLINSFYMLSDEDKKDVVDNINTYSLDDIEAKLSVICVRKKVNFDLDEDTKSEEKTTEDVITTFNLESATSTVPAWISAVKDRM